MSPFLYALNIGTLATWLTVGGASTVACVVRVIDRLPALKDGKAEETEVYITPMDMGSAPPAAPSESTEETTSEEQVAMEELPELPELPEMPEVPQLAELEPLPDVPDMPEPPPARSSEGTERPKPAAAKPATSRPKASNRTTTSRASTSGQSGQGTGQGNGTAKGAGSSAVGADRWVGGRMPKPNYPTSARREGKQGRVVVLFSVDERGYVVSASISSGCAHSELNEEALRTVRRWKFRPGARASASRPIVFQLN